MGLLPVRRRDSSDDRYHRAGRALLTYVELTMDDVSSLYIRYRRRRRAGRVLYIEVEVVKLDMKKWAGEVSLEPLQLIGFCVVKLIVF